MMKNNKFKIILLTIFALLMNVNLISANSRVTFENKAEEFIVLPEDKDLFTNFKNVMPGDNLDQEIIIENSEANDFTIRMNFKLHSIDEEYTDFLEKLILRLTIDDYVIFEDLIVNTLNLEEYILLYELDPGESVKLIATLMVPIELNNEYQSELGQLDWTFMVEEIEKESPVKDCEPDDLVPIIKPPKEVITGLLENSYLYIITGVTASILVILLLNKKFKKR